VEKRERERESDMDVKRHRQTAGPEITENILAIYAAL